MKDYCWYIAAGWDFATTWQMGIVVPDLTGGDLDNAGKLLYPVGCTVGTITYAYSATVASGAYNLAVRSSGQRHGNNAFIAGAYNAGKPEDG
jgi:hypothetical protein